MPASSPRPWRAFLNVGTLVSGAIAALLLWIPTHSIGESLTTAILMVGLISLCKLADPLLEPVWTRLARLPRIVLVGLALAVPTWFSITQIGASAAGKEITTARQTLLFATLIAYVLLRPLRRPKETAPVADRARS